MKDGDLLATIRSMLCLRGPETVQVSEDEGHATYAMVANGMLVLKILFGNVADSGRLRQHDDVITAFVIFSGSDAFGVPSFLTFIGSWLPFLSRSMMVLVALFLMPWFGTKVVSSKLVPHPFVC